MKLTWSERAQADILNIGRYIASNNPAAAVEWIEQISARVLHISDFRQVGRVVPKYSKDDLREVRRLPGGLSCQRRNDLGCHSLRTTPSVPIRFRGQSIDISPVGPL